MRIGHTHADVYDRESEYWQDIEDAQNAQFEAQKKLAQGGSQERANKKIKQPKITGIVPQEEMK
ncbi:hypothetical protein [Lysinibacillus sphaericus]|uniref:hypothetical protein n=1 Tax=Lysinibacillus sphaericus TaxID=1421 RepID=UPI00055B61F9|nr:hypothetical protein [Lysinibacillus sphaericus]